MSLYNMMYGFESTMPVVLGILKVGKEDIEKIPRFRDAYFAWADDREQEPVIVILTRTGGANRVDYQEGIEYLRSLPNYSHDVNDEFDNTFALFYYKLDETYKESIKEYLQKNGEPKTLRQKTDYFVNNYNK